MFNTQSRSQVGIGTLIVFIAMVLVAAIASGVLIQTAGLLQSQAQQTGEETTSEVSDLLTIDQIVGFADSDGGDIKTLNVSIRLASGSDPINVSKASYAIETATNATFINGNPDETSGLTLYQQQSLKSGTTILSEQGDIIVAEFKLTTLKGIGKLKENGDLTFIVNSPAGASTRKNVNAPRRIKANEEYIL